MKKTLILGATTNPSRYAFQAARSLTGAGHQIVPVGIKKGDLYGQTIINDKSIQEDIDTVTLYIGPHRQGEWEDYILDTKPRRVIFNPGTENVDLANKLKKQGIEPVYGCTLVMISVGQY